MNLFQIASIRANRDGEEMDLRDLDIVDDYVRELFKIENKTLRERVLFKDLLQAGNIRATSYSNSYCLEVDDEELDELIALLQQEDDKQEKPKRGAVSYHELLNDTSFTDKLVKGALSRTERLRATLSKLPTWERRHFHLAVTIEGVILDLCDTLKGYGYAVNRSRLENVVIGKTSKTWRRCALPGEPWAFCPIEKWLTREGKDAIVEPPQQAWERIFNREVEAAEKKAESRKAKRGSKPELPRIPYAIATEIWKRLNAAGLLDGTAQDFGRLFDPDIVINCKEPPKRCTFKASAADFPPLCRWLTRVSEAVGHRHKETKYTAFRVAFNNELPTNPSAHKHKETREYDAIMQDIIDDINDGKLK